MAATCPTSSSIPPTSPAPCAPVPACGLELARSSTASRKKTLPLLAASAVRKTTSGELVSSPAGSSSRRAITTFPSPEVFSGKNAKNCSLTERRIGNGCELDFPPHALAGPSLRSITSILVDRSPFAPRHQSQLRPWWIRQHRNVLQEVSIRVIEEYGSGGTPSKDDRLVSRFSPAP